MRITLEVTGPEDPAATGAAVELRTWLRGDPALRDRVERLAPAPPVAAPQEPEEPMEPMGGFGEIVSLLLQPGGLTVTLAAAVVAWLQTRRGSQTVTITRPDGTQVVVTSEGVRGLTPESSGELAERVARALQGGTEPAAEGQTSGEQASGAPSGEQASGTSGEQASGGRDPGRS
ncbi:MULTISPECIES: hypothetical protein [unclassified Streptomyces]|uniref:effector-associated constant component EACC1 n=1 Tax=unclassified Streptomyces TaxID=2593676 RepID=UPI00070142C9|nr:MULTISPECIES: hypothetical protein [unclassified Streptomyces]KQX58974.1 hypothetical protein ASD33_01285 [Streptomyces sp. Root1304]KRB00235.1 hypothetical protein ASE09_01285 [Streptomyces sp. Root66D1]